jgi:hypothetical protein
MRAEHRVGVVIEQRPHVITRDGRRERPRRNPFPKQASDRL